MVSDERSRAIEAVCMVATEPVPTQILAELVEASPTVVAELCDDLARSYDAEGRGFTLVKVAGGYRFQSHPDMAAYVERFVVDPRSARLSTAALETLAIVAYRQPVSRAQMAAIRGVNVDAVIRTLLQRGLVAEVGRDPGPGQAVLYGTTDAFLEQLGLSSLADLPAVADFAPDPGVAEALEATLGLGIDRPGSGWQ